MQLYKSTMQKIILAYELFIKHEMANHAAAGAYAFLLSAIPVVLVLVYVSFLILGNSQAVLELINSVEGFKNLPVEAIINSFFQKALCRWQEFFYYLILYGLPVCLCFQFNVVCALYLVMQVQEHQFVKM